MAERERVPVYNKSKMINGNKIILQFQSIALGEVIQTKVSTMRQQQFTRVFTKIFMIILLAI